MKKPAGVNERVRRRGTEARALAHAARHEAPDKDFAVNPQPPNHRASHPVRFCNHRVVFPAVRDDIVAVLNGTAQNEVPNRTAVSEGRWRITLSAPKVKKSAAKSSKKSKQRS